MAILEQNPFVLRQSAPTDAYLPVSFSLAAAIYVIPDWSVHDQVDTDKELLTTVQEAANDALRDGVPIALVLTPAEAADNPNGMPTILRAVRLHPTARAIMTKECKARIYGEQRNAHGAVNAFLTTPAMRQELADWLVSIGGTVDPITPLN
jgi:hypothetical protein